MFAHRRLFAPLVSRKTNLVHRARKKNPILISLLSCSSPSSPPPPSRANQTTSPPLYPYMRSTPISRGSGAGQEGISVRVRSLPTDRGYTIFNFYQNQETIRGQPLISQYRVLVCTQHSHGIVHVSTILWCTGILGGRILCSVSFYFCSGYVV